MLGIYRVAAQLVASQAVLRFTELVSYGQESVVHSMEHSNNYFSLQKVWNFITN
jgi:hypothetical protein